jgi:hypothetical protein
MLVWANVVFSRLSPLPNHHACRLCLLKISTSHHKSNYFFSWRLHLHLPSASVSLQLPPLSVDCYILSNSPLLSTHANKMLWHLELISPHIASLLHRFLDEFTVERSMLLLTSKTEGECTWSLPLVVTSWRDGNGSPENERLYRKSTALKIVIRLLKWDPNHPA